MGYVRIGTIRSALLTCKAWNEAGKVSLSALREKCTGPAKAAKPLYEHPQSNQDLKMLPTELMVSVFCHLDTVDLQKCRRVCKGWNIILSNWKAPWSTAAILRGSSQAINKQWSKLSTLSGQSKYHSLSLTLSSREYKENWIPTFLSAPTATNLFSELREVKLNFTGHSTLGNKAWKFMTTCAHLKVVQVRLGYFSTFLVKDTPMARCQLQVLDLSCSYYAPPCTFDDEFYSMLSQAKQI
jgi:hypothetical protein